MKLPAAIVLSLFLLSSFVRAEPAPAGYVVSVFLTGEDTIEKTAVVREGKELPPKLMMPLYSGDVVFVRDPASRVSLELGGGQTVDVGSTLQRYDVSGEIPTGDDAWSLFAAIGGVLAGGSEEVPENMASKGDSLTVPLAVHGPNLIVKTERKLWLAWQGGTGPFTVSAKLGAEEIAIAPTEKREIDVPLEAGAGDRLAITIRDSRQQIATVRFRLRDAAPALPDSLQKASPGPSAETLVTAAWLASVDKGAWAVEAAQILHAQAGKDQAAAALLARMVEGWKP
ncbi:MAG: hypothetical protein H7X89_16680 [Rhizobiales bacterium]|nr:hypothetical protein [Hyphomicrobiales bacterium]